MSWFGDGLGYSGWSNQLDSANFPDPFADYASLAMPESNQLALRVCLVPGTLVEHEGCQFAAIENTQTGDRVLSLDGLYHSVKKVNSRRVAEEIVELKIDGLNSTLPLRITANHEMPVVRGPRLKSNRVQPWKYDIQRMPAGAVKPGDWLLAPISSIQNGSQCPAYTGWLLGMYIAENVVLRDDRGLLRGTRFNLGYPDETVGIIDKLQRQVADAIGEQSGNVDVYTPPSRPDVRLVSVYDAYLGSWLLDHGGELAIAKRLSPAVFGFEPQAKLAIIAGWLDGDGTLKIEKGCSFSGISGTTISLVLAYQMVRLANSIGLIPSVSWTENKGYARKDGAEPGIAYRVSFNKSDSRLLAPFSVKLQKLIADGTDITVKQERCRSTQIHAGFVYRRVLAVDRVKYTGPVYNLEVEGDHSYTANLVGVFNCEYVFLANGTYREASRRLVSYFITEVETDAESDDLREDWKKFLDETIDVKNLLHTIGLDIACFHGDTLTTTRDGVFKLRELAGKTVDVLSKGGVYRPATFKSFGKQRLMEVTFSDGRKILATPEHEWIAKNCSDKLVTVPTTKLREGYRIERTVAARPAKNDEFYEGVRHGFVFGDGSTYNDGLQAAARFFGDKDAEMLKYFGGHGCEPRWYADTDYADGGFSVINGLPARYKQLPENARSDSYWYGFVCGFLAADGTADTYGCALLTQTKRKPIEVICEQLARIGMVAGPIRWQRRKTDLSKYRGRKAVYDSKMHIVTLLKRFMQPGDFLLSKHRQNFVENYKPTSYGKYIGIKSVRSTHHVTEVFCCVEPETHTFVVDNGILTGNCYGNSFISVIPTFTRYLLCPKCKGIEKPLRAVVDEPVFRYRWDNFAFCARCPKCEYNGPWRYYDRPSGQHNGFRVKRWNPHHIELLHDEWTEETRYIWKIPEDYRRQIREGKPHIVEHAPKQVIDAVKNNNYLLFERDFIHHMKEDALAGVINRGWGLSRVLINFRQLWYVQVLHRYNEALALDYIIPFRLLTPVPGDKSTGTDVLLNMNAGGYMAQIHAMLRRRIKEPTAWNTLPFPVQYQSIGGDAKALAPGDLLTQGAETMLNAIGVPAELYRASMTMQVLPAALRLFEASHVSIPHNFNRCLRFVVRKAASMLKWEPVNAKLEKVTHADDANRQLNKLQLMASGDFSKSHGLRVVGGDWRTEVRQMMDDQKFLAEEQAKLEEKMENSSQMKQMSMGPPPGQAPAGGQPGQPGQQGQPAQPGQMGAGASILSQLPQGPGQKITPEEQLSMAQTLAQQLLGMPESQKDSELRALKSVNPNLHSIVRSQMDDIRGQARLQGGNQQLASMFGKQGSDLSERARRLQKKAERALARRST